MRTDADLATPNGEMPPDVHWYRSERRRLGDALAQVVGWIVHALLGATTAVSGLIMPPGAVALLALAWLAGAFLLIRWRDRPGRVVAVPLVLWTVWFAVAWAGDAWFGWTA